MYTVVGSTGNTGRVVVRELLAAGCGVRAVGRDEGRLAPLAALGAEPVVADVSDVEAVARACDGAGGVYSMIPPRYDEDLRAWQATVGRALTAGIRMSGVPYVVNLSSVGAQHRTGTGPIAGLREQEDRLNDLTEADVLHLRPVFFMENFFNSLAGIREMGALAMPLPADRPIPMIAASDVGVEAARRLLEMDFEGHHTKELLGPTEYTMQQVAAMIGEAVGRSDLSYVQVPYELFEAALADTGMHRVAVESFIEMYRGFESGLVAPLEARSASNTTSTTFEEFAPTLAGALEV
jgi:uncharacterized protein YbjT (DUF2867 family)